LPTWNSAASPDAAGEPEAPADAPGDPEGGDAEVVADPPGPAGDPDGDEPGAPEPTGALGPGVAAGTGSGARARIPPRTSVAAAMPVTSPATIEIRGDISAGGYQYERSEARSAGRR
jgi:hypothetical protein